jgi:hypothetical protein
MSTADDMAEFETEMRFIGDGDLIFKWGRFGGRWLMPDWHFIGIPRTRLGVSYYIATGREDDTQYERLAKLVSPR